MAKKKQIKEVEEKVDEKKLEESTKETPKQSVEENVEVKEVEAKPEKEKVVAVKSPYRFKIHGNKTSLEIEMLDKGYARSSKTLSFSFKKGVKTKTNLQQINLLKKTGLFEEVK